MELEYKKLSHVKNRVKFSATIKKDLLEKERLDFVKKLGKDVKIPGFRPGKAPVVEIEKAVGYKAYIEAINSILPKTAIEVLEKEKLNPISTLDYNFDEEKKDKDDNITFTFEFLIQPEIDTSRFKKIKVKKEEVKVTDKDINETIQSLIKTSLPREKWEKYIKKEEGSKDENLDISEDLIKDIGYEDAKTLKEFKDKVRESLENVKSDQAQNKYVSTIVEEALKLSDFEVPHEYIHREVEYRESEFKKRIGELKLNMDVYLRSQNKTIEDIRSEWHKQSETDLATDLLLVNISVKENLVPSEKEVDEEIKKLDKESQEYYKNENNRSYLKTGLSRNKGLAKLIDIVEGK